MLTSVTVVLLLGCLVSAYEKETVTPAYPFHSDSVVWLRSCWEKSVIPFYIDKSFSQSQIDFIYKMIAVFHKETCLRWVEYTPPPTKKPPENEHHFLQMPDGTFFNVSQLEITEEGYIVNNHVQFIKVGDGRCRTTRVLRNNDTFTVYIKLLDHCFNQNAVMHEMMHALGFHHEHQRSDRNCYVSVVREADNLAGYKIEPHEPWLERYPYDKYSVLHYARSHIMVSRRQKKRRVSDFLGNAHGHLTHLDLSKIMYKFCGGPHYCDVSPEDCRVAADWRQRRGCVRT